MRFLVTSSVYLRHSWVPALDILKRGYLALKISIRKLHELYITLCKKAVVFCCEFFSKLLTLNHSLLSLCVLVYSLILERDFDFYVKRNDISLYCYFQNSPSPCEAIWAWACVLNPTKWSYCRQTCVILVTKRVAKRV